MFFIEKGSLHGNDKTCRCWDFIWLLENMCIFHLRDMQVVSRYIMWQKLYQNGTHKTVTSQGDFFRACSPAINMLLSFSLYQQDSRLRAILFTINFKMPPKKVSVMMK